MLSGEEGEAAMNKSVSLERPLADDDRLEVTVKGEGKSMFQPPSGWMLTADDIVETRCLSQSQSMYFPVDPDTTERLQRVLSGGRKLSRWERLLRRLKGTDKC